eukprot:CAMPEP_0170484292 /NCGR_PEP_ID=MMETSP0208-20121228/3780_1 /TAXON_ID=197538 /ORGANISM="Strombidium inclinatum, Strain S3" /LENGTH=144 /DNA_ID=CAMNT_0010757587 /DNA_START=1111 /DNA_END=1545 /DNA_ORIENTATION=-
MQVVYALEDLLEQLLSVILGVHSILLLGDGVQDLYAVNVVHHLVDFTLQLVVKELEGLHDVGVVEVVSDGELFSVGHLLFFIVFSGDLGSVGLPGVILFFEAEVDLSVHAFAQFLAQFVLGFEGAKLNGFEFLVQLYRLQMYLL